MATSINDVYRRRQGTSITTCPPPQPTCTTCGMLECVCRPRFFAGQVLNADDLNRLDAYIRAKNRLHNRQLHGWGVVNGLEVMCNPCGDGVAVGCGYALSPCGEDIVVCDAVSVNVCELILRCKDAEKKRGLCQPFQDPQSTRCDAGEEEWILAIRYAEKPARGVKPLYAPTEIDCDCSCGNASCTCGGGGAKRGCGCGARSPAQCTCGTQAKPRGAPVQCEPTVVCEGFAFEVYRKPPQKPVDPEGRAPAINADSPLVQRFLCCYDDLVTQAPKMPGAFDPAKIAGDPNSWNAWYQWACRYKERLLTHFQYASGYNCDLLAKLSVLVIVMPNPAGIVAFTWAVVLMFLVLLDALLACLCSALLPPCPMPTDEVRVPLATLHVAANPCRVLRVCNWTVERKFATTFPALQYWLSVLPYGAALRQALQTVCCFDVTSIFRNQFQMGDVHGQVNDVAGVPPAPPAPPAPGGPPGGGAAAGGANEPNVAVAFFREQAMRRLDPSLSKAKEIGDASTLLAQSLFAGKPLDPEQLVNTLLVTQGDATRLSPLQSANLPQTLVLSQIVRPIAQAGVAPFIHGSLGALASMPGDAEAAALRDEIASLRATVDRHDADVGRLHAESETNATALQQEIANLNETIVRHSAEIKRLKTAAGTGTRTRKGPR